MYIKLKVEMKESSFLHDLLIAIVEESDGEKIASEEHSSLRKFPLCIIILHVHYKVNEKHLLKNFQLLKLLNEMNYDYNEWKQSGWNSPTEVLKKSDSTILCKYLLFMINTLFCKAVNDHSLKDVHLKKWISIYGLLVSDHSAMILLIINLGYKRFTQTIMW